MTKVAPGVSVVLGDITLLHVDAIVNAANHTLLGGGGVDGAIHRAAGPELLEECRRIGGCPTGEARITGAYRLPARWVIHAVGPVYRGGQADEARLLRSAYESALLLAAEARAGSVAFPCISTGAYGYPKPEACDIAVEAVLGWMSANALPRAVVFCSFDRVDFGLYTRRLDEEDGVARASR